MRDDLSQRTKTILAARAGHRCSNSSCRLPTIGPASDNTGYVILGEAAHITAASEGGPRYDPNLTPDQRKHADNGIWCCPRCAAVIDKDEDGYLVETIRKWKTEAEAAAKTRLEQSGLPVSLLKGLEALDDYFTVPEVAKRLAVDEAQIYRWAMTQKLLLAIASSNGPRNYDEVRYYRDEHGNETKITRTYRTVFAMRSPDIPPYNCCTFIPTMLSMSFKIKTPSARFA